MMYEDKRSRAWEMAQARGLDNEWDEEFGYEDEVFLLKEEEFTSKFTNFVLKYF